MTGVWLRHCSGDGAARESSVASCSPHTSPAPGKEYSLTVAAVAERHSCRGLLTAEESEGYDTGESHDAAGLAFVVCAVSDI